MTKYVIKASVKSIVSDSRQVETGSLFLAYPGMESDGRDYIKDAINRGATTVIWDPENFSWKKSWKIENLPIENLRQQASRIASQFYKHPSDKLWVIGVTGTNGKTSITQWLGQCLRFINRKTAVVGTMGYGLPGKTITSINTTPDAVLLQGLLAEYVNQKAEIVAMEVSSHGLDQGRTNGVHFDVAVLSNLTRDHLDYHGSFENYKAAKKRLFVIQGLKVAVLNADEGFGVELKKELDENEVDVLTYGIDAGDVRASKIHFTKNGFKFLATTPAGEATVSANLLGRFNVYNVLAVLATLLVSKVSLEDAVMAIAKIKGVSGRMQKLGGGALPLVVVDYAHTPDALERVLTALKPQTKGKLICVFGCGGGRDKGKRALMGKVVNQLADGLVITSDNPRNENPLTIIQDILAGVEGKYAIEEDRAKAIEMAIANAGTNDTVVITGKGHELYQEAMNGKKHFSDIEEVEKAISRFEVMTS